MDPALETYAPLLTQANPVPTGEDESDAGTPPGTPLPNGLGVLVRAGSSLRRALLISLGLLLVSLTLLAILLAFPGRERSMVWDQFQSVQSVLVEVP